MFNKTEKENKMAQKIKVTQIRTMVFEPKPENYPGDIVSIEEIIEFEKGSAEEFPEYMDGADTEEFIFELIGEEE